MTDWLLEFPELESIPEPSVLSSDPKERKLARRLRIQRRIEAVTRQAHPEDEEVVEKTPIEQQIFTSFDMLDKLQTEGNEVVSSVKIANDARELERRKEEREMRSNLLKKLEEDDRECMQRYEEISETWPDILSSKDPLDIHAEMVSQNAKCFEILAKKDAVIAELRKELINADEKFIEDQEKQNEDINILTERMDNQASIISKAYREEIALIEKVIESERKLLLETVSDKWETLFKKIKENDCEGIEKRKEIMRKYQEEMKRVMIDHHEEFRSQKIQLEVECQRLQQEVQNTKALCLMNVEKLDYNYAVLKRREEENTIVKNQQKRRINKLQDVLSNLKKCYIEVEENTRSEIQRLTDQVLKAYKNILELEEKSGRFASINERKYLQIWNMNVKAANELVEKVLRNIMFFRFSRRSNLHLSLCSQILTADKVIHEQALGLEWYPSEEKFLTIKDLSSYQNTLSTIKKREEMEEQTKAYGNCKPATTLEEINLERRMINQILKRISDQSGYLVEDDLRELLSPYAANDNVIIRLDNVFQALNITREEEIEYLLNFFLPYAYCPTCMAADTSKSEALSSSSTSSKSQTPHSVPELISDDVCDDSDAASKAVSKLISIVKEKIETEMSSCSNCEERISSTQSSKRASAEASFKDQENNVKPDDDTNIKDDSIKKQDFMCNQGHLLEIQTAHVTRALRKFIENYCFFKSNDTSPSFKERLSMEKLTISRGLSEEDVLKFWRQYEEIFPTEKERLWDGLLVGLKKYYNVLKERHELNTETENLRKQNAELRRLLKTFADQSISSNISEQELRSITDML